MTGGTENAKPAPGSDLAPHAQTDLGVGVFEPVPAPGFRELRLMDPDVAAWESSADTGGVHPVVQQLFGRVTGEFASDQPFDMDGRVVDGIAAFMIHAAAFNAQQVEAAKARGEIVEAPVKISLASAREKPELILEMIQSAEPTDFTTRILEADVEGFKDTLNGYLKDDKRGVWDSLKLTHEEIVSAIRQGISKHWAKKTNQSRVQWLQRQDAVSANSRFTWGLATSIREHIVNLDAQYRDGQPGAAEGSGSVLAPSITRKRLERLAVIQFATAAATPEAAVLPDEIGATVLGKIVGGEQFQQPAEPSKKNYHPMLLDGLRYAISTHWAERQRQHLMHHPNQSMGGESSGEPLSEELLDLQALYVAATAEQLLHKLNQPGADETLTRLINTIAGVEAIQAEIDEQNDYTDGIGSLFGLEQSQYSEAAFAADVRVAATVRRVIHKFNGRSSAAAFDVGVLATFKRRLADTGLLQIVNSFDARYPATASVLSTTARFAMSDAEYAEQVERALNELTQGDSSNASNPQRIQLHKGMLSAKAARLTDRHGRYSEAESVVMEELGEAQRLEDFPGTDTVLCFYGDMREGENEAGVLEAMAIMNGFTHIDTAGHSPVERISLRQQLTKLAELARQSGHNVQLHNPYRGLPPDYRCEVAHFLGRMPVDITAEDILTPVIDGGIATIPVEANQKLVQAIKRSALRDFDYQEMPTELVRFMRRDGSGKLDFDLGHGDPNWQHKEHTLVIFFRKNNGENSVHRMLRASSAAESIER